MDHERNIVVIGAALGGLTALVKMASNWPGDLPAAVLVALATPDQPGPIVLQIVKSNAAMAVAFAVDGEPVRLGRMYLAPPGKHLLVESSGVLRVDHGNPFIRKTPSVDRLFISAAATFGTRVIGVVLSGNSEDGAKGLRAIEAAGGIGIVQEPKDAAEPQMPMHAIENDHPDYCLRAREIAKLVGNIVRGKVDVTPLRHADAKPGFGP